MLLLLLLLLRSDWANRMLAFDSLKFGWLPCRGGRLVRNAMHMWLSVHKKRDTNEKMILILLGKMLYSNDLTKDNRSNALTKHTYLTKEDSTDDLDLSSN